LQMIDEAARRPVFSTGTSHIWNIATSSGSPYLDGIAMVSSVFHLL